MYMAAFDKELAKLHKYKFNTNVFQISLEIKKISLVPIGRKNFQIFFYYTIFINAQWISHVLGWGKILTDNINFLLQASIFRISHKNLHFLYTILQQDEH